MLPNPVGMLARLLLVACALVSLCDPALAQPGGKAVIISVNDVYQIEGVDESKQGGMPRVRSLRAELERTAPDLLLLHAGDFLGPSFLGRTYGGAQMIDLMNIMDGKPAIGAFDHRMFATFGNHEFDDTHCGKDGPLAGLVTASEFTWLAANIDFSRCEKLRALVGNPNIASSRIIKSGGLRIGLYGLTLALPNYSAVILDPLKTSCLQVAELRGKGVDAVVALTHLPWRTDLALLGLAADGSRLPADGRPCLQSPDLVIGGHDHDSLALPSAAPRLFKADADAVSAWVIELSKDGKRALQIKGRLEQLDEKRAADPLAQRVVKQWIKHHDERFCLNECIGLPKDEVRTCRMAVADGACLKQTFARTGSLIETEEIRNRSFETGFGDWLADQMRDAGGADVAFLNAGTIRLNHNLSAGTMLTRRHLEQMIPFKNTLVVREIPGSVLWQAMDYAVAQRGEGAWAHFSGMAVKLGGDVGRPKVTKLLVRRQGGGIVEITPTSTEPVKIASSSFVLANGDGHGFRLCQEIVDVSECSGVLEATTNWPLAGDAADLAGLLRMKLRQLDPDKGLQLSVDRRLCDRGQSDCLIDRW